MFIDNDLQLLKPATNLSVFLSFIIMIILKMIFEQVDGYFFYRNVTNWKYVIMKD